MAGASLATNLGHFCPLLLIKDLVTNCHKIGHLFFDLVELDKTYPHYLILLGWYWNTEEGSTNLQARFYPQQELGSGTMEGRVTRTGRAEETFAGLDCEAWSSLAAAVLLKQRLEAGCFPSWLSQLYDLEQRALCEVGPSAYLPRVCLRQHYGGKTSQKSGSHVGERCRMWKRGTE